VHLLVIEDDARLVRLLRRLLTQDRHDRVAGREHQDRDGIARPAELAWRSLRYLFDAPR
jgi:DNA-binding response OmpR family regulator